MNGSFAQCNEASCNGVAPRGPNPFLFYSVTPHIKVHQGLNFSFMTGLSPQRDIYGKFCKKTCQHFTWEMLGEVFYGC